MRCLLLLAASFALMLVAPNGDDLKVVTLNGMPCGPEGTATSEGGKALNRGKNRFQIPAEGDIDPEVSLAAMLAPGNDVNRFNEKKAARIQGLVIKVMNGGNAETCNCGATNPVERDTHIPLALATDAPEIQQVIVEVTPRLRMLMEKQGVDWTTTGLQRKLEGSWIEVTGWLLFDTAHIKQAENTNPGNPSNFRATCWEVHPVTSIKVLDGPPAEVAGFQPASFRALQRVHASHLARSPNGKAALEKFHETQLSRFDKKERDLAEAEAKSRGQNA